MIKSKFRLTHADRVFQYLKSKDQPLSAYDILDGMRSEGVAAATTVYRALDKLLSIGLVHLSIINGLYLKELYIF